MCSCTCARRFASRRSSADRQLSTEVLSQLSSVPKIPLIVIAALLTYVSIALLGWSKNFRLDMAGVTGLIVSGGRLYVTTFEGVTAFGL